MMLLFLEFFPHEELGNSSYEISQENYFRENNRSDHFGIHRSRYFLFLQVFPCPLFHDDADET